MAIPTDNLASRRAAPDLEIDAAVRRNDRLASLGMLTASIAHEIKNPLTAVRTFAELLPERGHDPEFQEDFATLVGEEMARIDGLVNRLLDYARPTPEARQPVALWDVVERALALTEAHTRGTRIEVETHNRTNLADGCIVGDFAQLEQVVLNLLLNAIDAMAEGGPHRLTLTLEPAADCALILSIADTGSGIEPATRERLFQPFFTTKPNGNGLGLVVARQIVLEHGGSLRVDSQPGRGAVFSVRLPAAEAAS